MAANLVIQVLIVRYLSKSDYGAFAWALSVATLAQTVVLLGLHRSMTRFMAIYDEARDYGRVFGTIALVAGTILSLGLAAALLVYGLEGFLAGSVVSERQALSLLLILIFLAPLNALSDLLSGIFAVYSKPRSILVRRYVLAPALNLAVVVCLLLAESDVEFLAAGYVAAGAVGVAIYGVMLFRMLARERLLERLRLRSVRIPAREIFGFTLPLFAAELPLMAGAVPVLLLLHFGGAVEVAAFSVVLVAARSNALVMTTFNLLFTPVATRLHARDDREGIRRLYWRTALWLTVLSFPLFALTFSLAEPLTVALYGDQYRESAVYLALLSLGFYVNAATGFSDLTLGVFGKVRYLVATSLAAAIFTIGINALLIPPYGALGAAIGTSAAMVAHNLLKQAVLRYATGICFEWRYLDVYVVVALAALALSFVQVGASPPIGVSLALAGLVSTFVLWFARGSLEVAHTFPELMRFPLMRRLVGS